MDQDGLHRLAQVWIPLPPDGTTAAKKTSSVVHNGDDGERAGDGRGRRLRRSGGGDGRERPGAAANLMPTGDRCLLWRRGQARCHPGTAAAKQASTDATATANLKVAEADAGCKGWSNAPRDVAVAGAGSATEGRGAHLAGSFVCLL